MPVYGSQQNFSQIPVLGLVPEANPTAPSNPTYGQLWTDRSVSPAKVRWWDGTKWVAADGTSIPNGFITDIMVSPTAGISLSKLAVDPLARANHTGTQLANTISNFDAQVRTSRLDQMAAPTNSVDYNGQRLTNLATPVGNADAVTKAYVDNSRAGISVKDPVRVALQSNVNISSPGATLDGVSMVANDRVLLSGQTVGTQNGLYVYNSASTAMTRTADSDGAGEVFDGSMVAVAEGSWAGYQYIQTSNASGAPGSWTQTWIVFTTGGQTYTAGTGLTLTGTSFAITSPIPVNLGGTGATNVAGARANLGAMSKFSADLGAFVAGTPYVLTHSLGTVDVLAVFRTVADGRSIEFDWAPTSAAAVTVYPDLSYNSGAIHAVVAG